MNLLVSIKPFLAVLIPVFVVPGLILTRKPNNREIWTFTAAIIKFLIIASMIPAVIQQIQIEYTIAQVLPGIAIKFRVDSFGLLFALTASFLWIVTSVYSIGYMRGLNEHSQTRYYCFFALSLCATVGVAFSANLLTLYLFYEMLSFATYPLVTHHQNREARGAGRKYLFYILGGSIGLILPAIIIVYNLTGTLEFIPQGFLRNAASDNLTVLLLMFFIFGFAKAGIMPMHSWLPAAMVAPTPVSALLHAVAVVKVGAFCIVRIITCVFGTGLISSLNLDTVICVIASVTIILSSLVALTQDRLKSRLAFSTIGQLSYIVLGAALISKTGMTGAMLHIVMHAFGKITLFFCAGSIFVATGVKNISRMAGIGRQMPVTMAAFFIGSLSVIGLPPFGGFISKWYLLLGSMESDNFFMTGVILFSSLLNAAYFLPIVFHAFFCPKDDSVFEQRIKEAQLWCVVPSVVTASCSVIFFFFPHLFVQLAINAVNEIM